MKMKVLILVAIFLFGSCAESVLDIDPEDETNCTSRSGTGELDKTLAYLKGTRLGGPLLACASLRCPPTYMIEFTPTSGIPERSMRYMGMGWVLYNPNNLQNGDLAQLAFHELFHIYKYGNAVKQVLNDEIEAYMAQYIFCLSIGRPKIFSTPNDVLTRNIKRLVECMDINAGTIISDNDKFLFYYYEAMSAIKQCPLYRTIEGESLWVEYPICDISTLCDFLRIIK